MNKAMIPAWKLPSTVLFLDDNLNFLRGLSLSLDVQRMTPVLFDDILKATAFITNRVNSTLQKSGLLRVDIDEPGLQQTSFDISTIHKKIYDANRFKYLTVIVLDYAMPLRNGLELAAEIREKYGELKILLLTGEASEKLAVHGFNTGIIDKFVRKDSENFKNELNNAIEALQKDYFLQKSAILFSGDDNILSSLRNSDFVKKFNDICQKYSIVEYYLVNTEGSFLLLDGDANAFLLTVKDNHSMKESYNIVVSADEEFPEQLLSEMKDKKKIICAMEDKIYDEVAEVENLLSVAHKIPSQGATYYYALNPAVNGNYIDNDKVSSYKTYNNVLQINVMD